MTIIEAIRKLVDDIKQPFSLDRIGVILSSVAEVAKASSAFAELVLTLFRGQTIFNAKESSGDTGEFQTIESLANEIESHFPKGEVRESVGFNPLVLSLLLELLRKWADKLVK